MMVVLSDLGGEFGFFESIIGDFVSITDPATFGFVSLIWI